MNRLIFIVGMAIAPFAISDAGAGSAASPSVDAIRLLTDGLVDQSGRRIDVARFDGHFILVNFIFTTCGSICPTQTAELAKFDRRLTPTIRSKVQMLSISVDPVNDTPAKLKTYAKIFGADPDRWTFATGSTARIAQIVRRFGAARPGAGDASFHTSEVRLFDRHHRLIQRYSGAPLADRQLREDLIALSAPLA